MIWLAVCFKRKVTKAYTLSLGINHAKIHHPFHHPWIQHPGFMFYYPLGMHQLEILSAPKSHLFIYIFSALRWTKTEDPSVFQKEISEKSFPIPALWGTSPCYFTKCLTDDQDLVH